MAHSKSTQKAIRVAARKQMRNKSVRSAVKTYITKAERLITAKELDSAKEAVAQAIGSLDKAAQKGVIHPNNAARHKSRLMKKLNQVPKTRVSSKK
jgi:small subunit ribosomal protein S20